MITPHSSTKSVYVVYVIVIYICFLSCCFPDISGDIVGLHYHAQEGLITSGVITSVSNTSVCVAFDQSEELAVLGDDQLFYIVKLANDVTYKRLKRFVFGVQLSG